MAHFAKINENNEVTAVVVVADEDCHNSDGVETESVGQAFLEKNNNWPAQLWIKTSYNTYLNQHKLSGTPFRGNYANVGYIWDATNNIFIRPRPYASWVLNTSIADWESPAGPCPQATQEQWEAGQYYEWNEATQAWQLLTE